MTRQKDGAGALKLLLTFDFHHHTDSVLHRHLIIGPDARCFSLTRACKIEVDALRQLIEHVPKQVIPHNVVRVIENSAHPTCYRCSKSVLTREE